MDKSNKKLRNHISEHKLTVEGDVQPSSSDHSSDGRKSLLKALQVSPSPRGGGYSSTFKIDKRFFTEE